MSETKGRKYVKKTDNDNMGRPRIEIDKRQFESLCGLQCTKEEISAFFDIHSDTLNNWCYDTYGDTFSVVFEKYSASGKISLRRSQFKLAERNSTMAIFLGKQILGQRDYVEHGIDVASDETFEQVIKKQVIEREE